MKTNQSFIFNKQTEEIKIVEKPQFIKELCGIIAKKTDKVLSLTEVKKMNNLSYAEIIQEFDNCFNKVTKGIYVVKLNDNNVLVCLLDKTIEDFQKVYKKIKSNNSNSKVEKAESNNTEVNLREKSKEIKVDKEMVKKNIKRAAIAVVASLSAMSLFACSSGVETKQVVPIDPNAQESIAVGDSRQYDTKELQQKIKTGKANVYGQEMIQDSSGNNIDWTNKRTDINESNHRKQVIEGGAHPTYCVNLGDEKTWEIGPNGYPEPPEEFKYRERVSVKAGMTPTESELAFANRVQRGWNISYVINNKTYTINGSDINGSRTVFLENGTPKGIELLNASSNDKSTNEQLLALAMGNDAWVQAIKGQAQIKDSLGTK